MKLMESEIVCFRRVCRATNCTDAHDDQLTFRTAKFRANLETMCSRQVVYSTKNSERKPRELVVTGEANAITVK